MQTVKNTLTGASGFQQTDTPDLHGKTVLVTGGTAGIGFEVARAFALSKARVLLLSLGSQNGHEVAAKIQESVSVPSDVKFIECDLGNLKNVKEVADNIRATEKRLDILVAGAGVGVNKFDVSSDGIDRHFAVNYLGHFLLINRLLPLIRETSKLPDTSPPRIVSIASELHRTAPSSVKFATAAEITEESTEMGANALYARSKLAVLLFTKYGLTKRVVESNGDRIFALATDPGAVHTGQQDQFKEAYGEVPGTVLKNVVVPFMRSPDQGSLSTIWAATSEEIEEKGWQGCYFTDPGQLGKETAQASDEELGTNLWNLSNQLVTEKLGNDALLPWNKQ